MANESNDKFKKRYTDKLEYEHQEAHFFSEEEHEEHPDEKWLVSYADMMTLLFGLFVMLYAIAMETQGKPEKFFSDISSASKTPPSTAAPNIKEKEQVIASLKKELANAHLQIEDVNQKLKNTSADADKLKALIVQLQGELQQIQAQQGKNLPTGNDKSVIKELALLRQLKIDNEKTINDLKIQIQTLNVKNEELKGKVLQLDKASEGDNFMIIVLKWESEKHDLDLKVIDPSGRNYNFEQRAYKESTAKFVLDSRSGPGVEMWETPQIQAGDYKIEFSFYNSYGNNKAAQVSGTIITHKGEFPIPSLQMDMQKNKKVVFKLQTTKAGNVIIQPQP